MDLSIHAGRYLRSSNRLCMSKGEIQQVVLLEVHDLVYFIHHRGTKVYQDLKQYFLWYRMNHKLTEFVSQCLVCQQVKIDHQRVLGILQPLLTPEQKWKRVTIYILLLLLHSSKGKFPSRYLGTISLRWHISQHFIQDSLLTLETKYMHKAVRLHGFPVSFIPNRDNRFKC